MKQSTISFLFILLTIGLYGQVEDPILFKVEDQAIHVSEFDYIYNKNNGDKADYKEDNLKEYLDLYVNFKLKVQRAKDMGLDTVKSLQKELSGYRRQLANSYLVDNEVSDQLIREVYDRKQSDLRLSHILISIDPKNPNQAEAQAKINQVKKMLGSGKSFEELVKTMSDDVQSKDKGGDLGFITAMLPDGFYELESAAYGLEPGEVSDIVSSRIGYHILKVTEKRPARGEMDVAHILVRKDDKNLRNVSAKPMIDSIYNVIKNGGDFEVMADKFSQDKKTAGKGGKLGYFGINRYEKDFEDAAFALAKDGDITKPIETKSGWHIIKRLGVKKLTDYSTAQKRLKHVVSKSDRFSIAKEALIEKIKVEGKFMENHKVYTDFVNTLNKEFFSYKWNPTDVQDAMLFTFKNGQKATLENFVEYCKKESKIRLRFNKEAQPKEAADKLYGMFVNDRTIKYEESNLENKYPEFKALMREYSEGILLFEATEKEVWNKASSDTTGLKQYYAEHMENYKWGERAKVNAFVINTSNAKELKKIWKFAKKKSVKEVLAKYNEDKKTVVSYREVTLEKESPELKDIKWKVGEISKPQTDTQKNKTTFVKIIETLPSRIKELSEAKGYIISDYQDQLEKQWIKDLKSKYKVSIDETIFTSMVKK